jgi:ASCH domain
MSKVYALSLKQPWAALLALGRKTIEVRRWPTARRGRILIHVARIPDERPEAWAHVNSEVEPLARQLGGILGMAELTSCITYRTLQVFLADCDRHLNEAAWFEPPVLYGFRFENARLVPFHRYPGWMRFFPVDWDEDGPSESATGV